MIQESVHKSEHRYRALEAAVGQIVWIMDPEGRLIEDSHIWKTYTGQSWEEAKEWGWMNRFHPEDYKNKRNALRHALGIKNIYEMESRICSAGGEYCHFLIRGVPILKNSGEIEEWIMIGANIHDYKMGKDLLEEKNIAIREMLGQLEIEKKKFREQVINNIEHLLLPILKKLKRKATTVENGYLELLEANLKELTGTFGAVVTGLRELTPKEVEICNMIRNGLSTKEIAKLLQVSALTIDTHRTNIRKKLKISKKALNRRFF